MRRAVAIQTKIPLRSNNAAAEVKRPDAVHENARDQRVLAVRPMAGQREPAAARWGSLRGFRRLPRAERGQLAWLDLARRLVWIAPEEDLALWNTAGRFLH